MTSKYDEMMRGKNFLPLYVDHVPPKVRQKAREELRETDDIVAPSVERMRELIRAEKNFKCFMEEEFLLQFLRARKYDAKRACALLLSMFELKKSYPEMFDNPDKDMINKIVGGGAGTCLPYRDPDGCIVVMVQVSKWKAEEQPLCLALTALSMFFLLAAENPVTQICGARVLVDVKGFNLRQMRCFTPRYIHALSRALRNTLPIRFKGIHFFNESTIFQYVWSVLKLVLTEKIRKRVHFHGDNQKSLHKYIPKDILPAEYGGDNIHFSAALCGMGQINKYWPSFHELLKQGYN